MGNNTGNNPFLPVPKSDGQNGCRRRHANQHADSYPKSAGKPPDGSLAKDQHIPN